ncbi:aldehyde dehydrogenase family protein [Pseudonocardia dioxanivorans]|uniref:aldehyde dehydrogenase family protein n=1 Tax=Pseudonocardia dioxanivorans TaxID=240495 RepID=UPI000CD16E31|nr:aldehyde dehydrogenase family protein [Pseudonocardia dioxanivorans]
MIDYTDLYIDGDWIAPLGVGRLEVVDPTTEAGYATIPEGSAADVDRAVAAAKAAFPAWSQRPPAKRAALLRAVADGIEARIEELAVAVTHEVGTPLAQSRALQVRGGGVGTFTMAAEAAEGYAFEERRGCTVLREPVGVVGAITPWNWPLNQVGAKVAYALAAGCTVVLKPSEVAPVNTFVLTEILDAAGFPPGVFNLVTGLGPVVGERLVEHPDVDMISFTGSTTAGKRVAAVAAGTVKRVALELGGKSANVLLDDADLATAVPAGVQSCFLNSGQTCSALTRLLVPRRRLAEVEDLARAAAEEFVVGDPFAVDTRLGPLANGSQRDRVRAHVRRGVEEGARLVTGGEQPPDGLDRGYFVRPTVFSGVTRDMSIAREEIFGPVLVIMPFEDDDDAVEIANSTVYGLSGGVSGSPERAMRVARRMRTGQVRVNNARPMRAAPFGGYGQSGLGREHGPFGLEEFLEVKAVIA